MRPVVALLAGGLARRMGGGDKCLRPLAGRPLLAHVIERMQPQSETLILNANGDPGRFACFGLPVVADRIGGHPGPLAGLLTGMLWALAHAPGASDLVTVPTDSPFLPLDLVGRLSSARTAAGTSIAVAASNGRVHPVVGLWPVTLAAALRTALEQEGLRKVEAWAARHPLTTVAFEGESIDPFFNVNSPAELADAERLLSDHGSLRPPPA